MLELYAYERAREPGAFSDAVYNANAHVVLHDDPAYRLESRDATGELTVQLLDADRTEVPAGARRPQAPVATGRLCRWKVRGFNKSLLGNCGGGTGLGGETRAILVCQGSVRF